ncbi:uncharacterized protein LOC117171442 [Belonocnema kinseyi]|uniref:uncharacterized protein LOC117171442 n=1 Tax=Belonocnema kinseyi TaxID=2817044 RepID=UPI00143CCA7C|nr:uncharacterized protein LOC117171442 [Belonocnema kinseyi]
MRTTIAFLLITSVVFFYSFVCVKATPDAGVKHDSPKKLPPAHEEMAKKEDLSGVFYKKEKNGEPVPVDKDLLVWKKGGAIFAWSFKGKKVAFYNDKKQVIVIENGKKKEYNDTIAKRLGIKFSGKSPKPK